jgi:glycosyltransferase involved in cell wall biosynthesis
MTSNIVNENERFQKKDPLHIDLSIIIPSSRPDKIIYCLEALNTQKTNYTYEVFVVGDIGEDIIYTNFSCSFISCDNTHANYRRNQGITRAKGDVIGLLDDDSIPNTMWVQTAVELIRSDPQKIITGPEKPVLNGEKSQLIYNVCQSPFSSGVATHFNTKFETVNWYEVPFCNCIFHRTVIDHIGLPNIDIPWDMDDFEFCFRANNNYVFYNSPTLVIKHDRYPNSFRSFYKYTWKNRFRTGEKMMTHSKLYFKIPILKYLFVVPYIGFFFLYVCIITDTLLIASCGFLLVYLFVLLLQIKHSQTKTLSYVWRFLGAICLCQSTTAVAYYSGILYQMPQRVVAVFFGKFLKCFLSRYVKIS